MVGAAQVATARKTRWSRRGGFIPSFSLREAEAPDTVEALNRLVDNELAGVVLPAMDLTGYRPTGQMIRGADLRKTTGLTVAMLNKLGNEGLLHTKLPDGFDLTGYKPSDRMLAGALLRNTTGLTVAMLNGLGEAGIEGTLLPDEFDLTGYAPKEKMLRGATIANTFGLSGGALNDLTVKLGFWAIKLPEVNLSAVDFKERTVAATDFSKTSGLSPEQLAEARGFSKCKFAGTGITEAELLKAGMTPDQIQDCEF